MIADWLGSQKSATVLRPAFLVILLTSPAWAQPLTDQQIAGRIVQESREAYYRTGHPCACPEDLARNGSRCGGRSAHSRPGGASPYCYPSDVPTAEIEAYRKRS